MPDEKRVDDVDKLLSDVKAVEDRREALISDLLKQKEAAIKAFDEKLAKLGYQANNTGKPRRSHHKKSSIVSAPAGKAAEKPKA